MKCAILLTLSTAILGAMATILPSQMGVEVVRSEDGNVLVREIVSQLHLLLLSSPRSSLFSPCGTLTLTTQSKPPNKRSCTNCVHVGDHCTIGEGHCYATEHAYCTDCGDIGTICVDTQGGSCSAP